ncbi:hypothetical protein A3D04_03000 [Candidatus Curtissbacteria bacterium RIFCSPHIGHO2_02_FULL_40_16b]|uniref:MBL fold hydrolase n=1 Tax=Candidatus Curtissbacteria bacterium RIFCSPHIGHO2_02_FULL_40_16b TaxID=1797714 RepID=A0A1F5G7Z0_9BACT|nr:MAG: hypothetical protein A3D04_03000 [Candidatus Curtissbacteria bacterium RIFCSPHIGHO2_02_FULL_40_16b]
MRISFYGACREVTGSNILVETSGKKFLLDCGFFQGHNLAEERNYSPFAYNPAELDCVIIGHAHLDHTGRLPKLVKDGFRGRIYCTGPTKELIKFVLDDSEKLMKEEAERDNHPPLYNRDDIGRTMELFETMGYGETIDMESGIKLSFKNAGHILGSALTVLEADGKKLVYTSDIGNTPSALLDPPESIENADYLICESTYGGRVHEDKNKRMEKLADALSSAVATNGVLMVPSFAIERTQELLHDIEHFCVSENCEKPTFYLDSPLATKVTSVFKKYPNYLSKKLQGVHKEEDFFGLDRLKITSSVEESKAINDAPNPKVIIAGSGMMNGGRILHHLKKYIENANNTLLIVGYQANGTLGRRIFDGQDEIRVFGENLKVKAKIKAIGSYSAHADLPQLLQWVSNIKNLKKVFIVHGESKQSLIFSKNLREKFNLESIIPQQGENYEL